MTIGLTSFLTRIGHLTRFGVVGMKKSTRHSKITGDFAEGLVLYWLSKHGYGVTAVSITPASTLLPVSRAAA